MLDIQTNQTVEALYKMVEIIGGKRINRFKTTDIKRAIRFHKWYTKKYKRGLLLEIIVKKKKYNWKEKKVDYIFE